MTRASKSIVLFVRSIVSLVGDWWGGSEPKQQRHKIPRSRPFDRGEGAGIYILMILQYL
jgi:hypothetical protein